MPYAALNQAKISPRRLRCAVQFLRLSLPRAGSGSRFLDGPRDVTIHARFPWFVPHSRRWSPRGADHTSFFTEEVLCDARCSDGPLRRQFRWP